MLLISKLINMQNQSNYELVIRANKSNLHYWNDIWSYRELFFFLAWKDILVRYKQTVIGISWSVLRPFLTMVILTIVFGKIAGLPSGNIPYPILVFSAMLPWQYFSSSFSEASNSLITNSNLLTKVYFPRLIIPTTSIVVSLIDFIISLFIMGILMLYYNFTPGWRIIILPIFLIQATILSLGTSYFISALNVKYRDFRYIVPFIVQFGLYISPVGFRSEVIPEKWQYLYSLNPMVGIIDGFRWAIIGGDSKLNIIAFLLSSLVTCVFFVFGIKTFRKIERKFADVV